MYGFRSIFRHLSSWISLRCLSKIACDHVQVAVFSSKSDPVLLAINCCYVCTITRAHVHTATARSHVRSHYHTFTRTHVHTFTRSHVLIVFTFPRSHTHTITRSHVHMFTRSHVHPLTRSHVRIFTRHQLHIRPRIACNQLLLRSHVLTFSCSHSHSRP